MDNILEIFSSRITKEREKRASYNKYIFNSHLVMFIVIVAGAIMLNYSKWLNVATVFQLKLVLFIILLFMAYVLTSLKIKTFIKEADAIFLLPLETKYKTIINRIIIPTVITKTFLALFFIGISYPIIEKLEISTLATSIFGLSVFGGIIIFTLIKYYTVVYYEVNTTYLWVTFGYFLLISLKYAWFSNWSFLVVLPIVLYFIIRNKFSKNINWYGAAEYDNARNEQYLKFINMFVDVPISITKVARRKYFDIFLPKLTNQNFNTSNSYSYYYIRAFLRQENTIFLVLRLLLVALLFIFSLQNVYVSMIVIISYNYLVVIQLMPIYKKINSNLWMYILPVDNSLKTKSFSNLALKILTITTLILLLTSIFVNYSFINIGYLVLASIAGLLISKYFMNKLK